MEIIVSILIFMVTVLTGVLVFGRRSSKQTMASENLKTEFQEQMQTALTHASDQFLKLAEERFNCLAEAWSHDLRGKKDLIDQQLQSMKMELGKVTNFVQTLEKDREAKFGQLTAELKAIGEQTVALTSSTSTLREALASSRSRGQWGERMAEDILRLMGLIEGVNYEKQVAVKAGTSRPDFVFSSQKI